MDKMQPAGSIQKKKDYVPFDSNQIWDIVDNNYEEWKRLRIRVAAEFMSGCLIKVPAEKADDLLNFLVKTPVEKLNRTYVLAALKMADLLIKAEELENGPQESGPVSQETK